MAIRDQMVFSRSIAQWAELTNKSVLECWVDLWEETMLKLHLILCGVEFLDQPL